MRTDHAESCDVAILGSGLAGTILASVLAKHGVRVALLEPGSHPRFAIGESTIPHTSLLLSILAERHGVPEIEHLAYPDRIRRHIGPTCGIKRSFGFAFQRPGIAFDPSEGLQFGTSSKDENHLFRQDVDAYMLHVAIRYGALYRDRSRVVTVDVGRSSVRLGLDDGSTCVARFVVDATGYRSVLAEAFGLRQTPTPLRHHSRTLFTHMIGVRPFEEDASPMLLPWHQSTLHHVFEGGWFWVIPFDNQPESTNPLTSVGLTLDPRRYPATGATPEGEFREFLERFPSVAPQFEAARAARSWVSTGRLQYSSERCVGNRYCLMSHAAGFVDALFSRGLINTVEVIYALIDPLLEALEEDDFDPDRFGALEELQQRVMDYNDRLVNGAFVSWSDFDVWNAWSRVWALGTVITEFRIMDALARYSATGEIEALRGEASGPAFSNFEDPDYAEFFRRAAALVEAYGAGERPAAETAESIFALTAEYPFPVLIGLEAMRRAGWLGPDEEISARNIDFARQGYRWALSNPASRDLFGNTETLYRWRARQDDPHLDASRRELSS